MESIFDKDFISSCINSKHDLQDKKYVSQRVSALFQTMPQDAAFRVALSDVKRLRKMYTGCSVKQQKCNILLLLRSLTMSLPSINKHSTPIFADVASFLADVAKSESDTGVLLTILEGALHMVAKFKATCLQSDGSLNHVLVVLSYSIGNSDQRIAQLSQELSETLKEIVRGSSELVKSKSLADASYAVLLACAGARDGGSIPRQLWCFQWIRFLYDLPGHLYTPHLIPTAAVLAQLADSNSLAIGRTLLELLEETRSEFIKVVAQNSSADFSAFYDLCCHVLPSKQCPPGFKAAILDWLREVLFFSPFCTFVAYFDKLLSCLLLLLDTDSGSDLYKACRLVNERAFELFRENDCYEEEKEKEPLLFARTLEVATPFLSATEVKERSCLASVEWIQLAFARFASSTESQQRAICALVPLVVCEKQDVAAPALSFLWMLSNERDLTEYLASQLVDLFLEQPLIIPVHIPLILSHLQGLDNNNNNSNNNNGQDEKDVSPCPALELFVHRVTCTNDARFVAKIAFTLHILILTDPAFLPVRHALPHAEALFAKMFACFQYQCVASLALCLLAQRYCLGRQIAELMAQHELCSNTLMQLDRLAELLNSPVFVSLRCRLVMRNVDVDLMECLYTILMMLPVSSPQHKALSIRLRSAGDCIRSCAASIAAAPAETSSVLEEKDKCFFEQLQLTQITLNE